MRNFVLFKKIIYFLGIVGIAKFSDESLVENEVLPQCWEQLTHKYVERRLLVAESCSALTPYVSVSFKQLKIILNIFS